MLNNSCTPAPAVEFSVADGLDSSARRAAAYRSAMDALAAQAGRPLTRDDVEYVSTGWFGHAEHYRLTVREEAAADESPADQALAVLRVECDADFLAQIDRAVAAGARWVIDPHHDDVVGLLRPGADRDALVVVYVADEEFEADTLALAEVAR